MNDPKSFAVEALEQEQARQRARPETSELDGGIEATFPASDPMSSTTTAIPTGAAGFARSNTATDIEDDREAPLVDQALASVAEQPSGEASLLPSQELEALRAEVAHLRESVIEIGSASVRITRAKAEDVMEDARARIVARPMAAVGAAALIGYLWGRTR